MDLVFVLIGVGLACYTLVYWQIRWAPKLGLVADQNPRSMHSKRTPTAAGLSFLLPVVLFSLIYVDAEHPLIWGTIFLVIMGGIDDKLDLPATPKLFLQFSVAALAVGYICQSPLTLPLGGMDMQLESWFLFLPLVAVVWLTNVYNFMDGADGFALCQACFVLAACGAFLLWFGVHPWAEISLLLLAACMTAFWFNKPQAQIFIGDAGALGLGFGLALLWLLGTSSTARLFWPLLILNSCFLVDATLTLVLRLLAGEDCFKAHKSHLYQQIASQAGAKHLILCLLGLNFGLVLPMALLSLIFVEAAVFIALGNFLVLSLAHLVISWQMSSSVLLSLRKTAQP